MTSANNFRALFGLARPKLSFNFNIVFKTVAQHGIDGGLIVAILLYHTQSLHLNNFTNSVPSKVLGDRLCRSIISTVSNYSCSQILKVL